MDLPDLPTELPAWLIESAITHEPEGCAHVAWRRSNAIEVLRQLGSTAVAVLGGDVLVRGPRGFEHSYDNWHSDHRAGESWADFAARSRREAEDYITRFPEHEGNEVAYALVLQRKPSARDLLLSSGA